MRAPEESLLRGHRQADGATRISAEYFAVERWENEGGRRFASESEGLRRQVHVTALLHIGAERTSVAIDLQQTVVIDIGWERIARDCFRRSPPNALELENAIARIEDGIAPARSLLPNRASLATADPGIAEIATIAGIAGLNLDLDAIERVFNRLADVSAGSPPQGLPDTPAFAATLLILREFMHHLGFPSITVRA